MKPIDITAVCSLITLLASLFLSAPAWSAEGEKLTTTAVASRMFGGQIINGKKVLSISSRVIVQFQGSDAKDVYAIGNVSMGTIEVDGKKLEPKKEIFELNGFNRIRRSSSSTLHPENGFGIEATFEGLEEKSKKIKEVTGTVEVLFGGTTSDLTVDNLFNRKNGPITSPVLDSANLKVSFTGDEEYDGKKLVGITMNNQDTNAFYGLELIGKDGKPVKESASFSRINDTLTYSYWLDETQRQTCSLKIIVCKGWKQRTIPFAVKEVTIK